MFSFSTFEIIIFIFFSLLLYIWFCSTKKRKKFEETGIKYLDPVIFFGNLFWSVVGQEHLSSIIKKLYDAFPGERYVGIFEFMKPSIVVKDLELIKKVTIKDFDHFHDIPFQIDETNDPVFGKALVSLKGLRWRQMRSAISPAFTSFKMKNMFSFMMDCASRGISFYETKIKNVKNYEIEINDLASRFTLDVISSTSFGFDIDSIEEPNNRFFTESMKLSSSNIGLMLKFTGFRIFPKFMKMFGIRMMPESSVSFFRKLIRDSLHQREKLGIQRLDMLHLLLEAKKGTLTHDTEEEEAPSHHFGSLNEIDQKSKINKPEWSDDDLVAQAIVFILAGQQTTSTVFSFLICELALNPEVQDRLSEEVAEVIAGGGKLTYKVVLEMEYLDMVVSECLRKWSPVPFNTRLCVQDYDMGMVREGSTDHYVVKKGDTVWIPVHSIHMDPSLWPDPDKFDPERFSKDNIKNIRPQSFLPFGSGPRACIGSRFALLNVKVMIFHYISKFKFEPCSKTVIPLCVSPKTLFIESKHKYWVSMSLRA